MCFCGGAVEITLGAAIFGVIVKLWNWVFKRNQKIVDVVK